MAGDRGASSLRPDLPASAASPSGIAMNTPAHSASFQAAVAQKSAKPPKQTLAGVRLRKHADYQSAYAASRKRQSGSMSWFLAPQPETVTSGPRVGLTVGKVIGKSHERNRIKRRMREVLRRHAGMLPPHCDLILHPRRVVLDIEFTKLEAEIVRILTQANTEAARAARNPTAHASAKPAS
jgi:ribonuclease P protein component